MDVFNHDGNNQDPLFVREDENNVELNRNIMFAAMVSCSLAIVLLLSSVYLFTKCVLLQRQPRARAFLRRLGLTMQLHHANESPTRGLNPAIIVELPVFVVEPKTQEEADGGVAEIMESCVVCLSGLEHREMAKLLPNCNHCFHVDCIDTWLASNITCPLCRARVQPRLETQLREGPIRNTLDGLSPMLVLPVLEHSEGTPDGGVGAAPIINDLGSRLSLFRRVLSWERSSRRIQPYIHGDDVHEDLERQ